MQPLVTTPALARALGALPVGAIPATIKPTEVRPFCREAARRISDRGCVPVLCPGGEVFAWPVVAGGPAVSRTVSTEGGFLISYPCDCGGADACDHEMCPRK